MGVSSTTAFWNTAVVFPLTINVPGLQCSLNSLLLDDLANKCRYYASSYLCLISLSVSRSWFLKKHCQILLLNFWLTVCHLFVLTGKEHTQTTVHCSQIKFSASRHCTLQQSEREGGRGANWPLHDKGLVCRYPLLFEIEVWHKSTTTTKIECTRNICLCFVWYGSWGLLLNLMPSCCI